VALVDGPGMTGGGGVSVAHLDLDAFYAAVEERDKPSLRGKPVVVGGVGGRGVVATASYAARVFGIGSAMSTAEARRRCGSAAFLSPRGAAYAASSERVMAALGELSPAVEPLSLDEAYVDLAGGGHDDDVATAIRVLTGLRAEVRARTGLTASVGAGSSKLVAKIASDLCKPDGLLVVEPGTEAELLGPLPVSRLWGVGPAGEQALHRIGIRTVAELAAADLPDVAAALGRANGTLLHRLARGDDPRRVSAEREARSIGSETTFATDVVDRARLRSELDAQADGAVRRLVRSGLAARTVTVKVRGHDFSTLTRSATLLGGTDDGAAVRREARRLLGEVDTADGVRLLGVSLSGLTGHVQEQLAGLFAEPEEPVAPAVPVPPPSLSWAPGADVEHDQHGRGWVWGAGLGRVTVRFETRDSGPGPVRTLAADDAALRPVEPEPLPERFP
jgi:DNA polymerase IV